MQGHESFWSEIKAYEELLAANPDSYCFARLSAVYLKVGLVDDALHAARTGVARHPAFVGGQRALCQACAAKGDIDGERSALERLTQAVPEDIDAQRRLGRLLDDVGETERAICAFHTALEFAPDDDSCRIELAVIERRLNGGAGSDREEIDSDDVVEDVEILEELELVEESAEEADLASNETFQGAWADEPLSAAPTRQDPFSTATLAELYVQQGFTDKALEIYSEIVTQNPLDVAALARRAELETFLSPTAVAEEEEYVPSSGSEDMSHPVEEAAAIPADRPVWLDEEPRVVGGFEISSQEPCAADGAALIENVLPQPPSYGRAEHAVETLEGWLENIRRIRSCR